MVQHLSLSITAAWAVQLTNSRTGKARMIVANVLHCCALENLMPSFPTGAAMPQVPRCTVMPAHHRRQSDARKHNL